MIYCKLIQVMVSSPSATGSPSKTSTVHTTGPSTTSKHKFIGSLQPCVSRLPETPPVNYAKGGDDFRCVSYSSLGRQLEGKPHMSTAGRVPITTAARFVKSDTVGPGPNFLAPISALKRQITSNRRSAESTTFGTSTRDGCLKLYATYTCKKF